MYNWLLVVLMYGLSPAIFRPKDATEWAIVALYLGFVTLVVGIVREVHVPVVWLSATGVRIQTRWFGREVVTWDRVSHFLLHGSERRGDVFWIECVLSDGSRVATRGPARLALGKWPGGTHPRGLVNDLNEEARRWNPSK